MVELESAGNLKVTWVPGARNFSGNLGHGPGLPTYAPPVKDLWVTCHK